LASRAASEHLSEARRESNRESAIKIGNVFAFPPLASNPDELGFGGRDDKQ
jgi:hypothetical protein